MQPKLRALYDRLGQLKGKASLVDGDAKFSLDALLANIVASSAIESELRGTAPMQIVSGPIHKPKVHYQAPERDQLDPELTEFMQWFKLHTGNHSLKPSRKNE